MFIAAAFLIVLALPFALCQLWWWFWFWIALAGVLGVFELVAIRKKGKTLSQMFWDWAALNPKKKYVLLVAMAFFWGLILVHLFCRIG